MKDFYKAFVCTGKYILQSGWGILKCSIDDVYVLWLAQNDDIIKEKTKYNYDDFVDTVSEFPIYFFISFDACNEFCKSKSNRYPYDRMMFWLRFQPEYWFGTVASRYIDYVEWLRYQQLYFKSKV